MSAPQTKTRRLIRAIPTLVVIAIMGCQSYSSENSCDVSASYAAGTANSLSQNINYLAVTGSENNIMSVTVGACGGTLNIPCATVTICQPGSTTNCATIDNLLLDTGSYGLRIFSSLIPSGVLNELTPETVGSDDVAECVSYLDQSIDWGPVVTADVYLGSSVSAQEAASLPIQLIDSSYGNIPYSCTCTTGECSFDTSPESTGFNGVLGVGLFTHDCTDSGDCPADSGQYNTCSGVTCTAADMATSKQVQNPVANLGSSFNQGIALELPGVPSSGAVEAPGYAIFGIGTITTDGSSAPNNPGHDVVVYQADSTYGDIQTDFEGSSLTGSFLDSGSNGLYFPDLDSLSECSGELSSFFCPCSITNFSATVADANGSNATQVSFSIGDASVEFDDNNPNLVFSNLGGDLSEDYDAFDWGLPYFLGHTVFIGISGQSATINSQSYTGPYFAF